MKIALAPTALILTAATMLAAPAAALAQSYANSYDRHDERPAYDHRVDNRTDNRAGPDVRTDGRADIRPGSQAYGLRGALIDTRAGYTDRPYAYTGRDGRFRDRFGVGVVSTGPIYAGSYEGGYADAGYVDGAPTYGYDGGQSVAYQASSPYIAGSYAAALERGYHGGDAQVYESTTSYTSESYVASSGGTCGQWTWDPAVGRYVWAC